MKTDEDWNEVLWLDSASDIDILARRRLFLQTGRGVPDNLEARALRAEQREMEASLLECEKVLPNEETIRIGRALADMDFEKPMSRVERRLYARRRGIPWNIFRRIEKILRIKKR
ncbi:hypothetical protein COW49_00520 [Candidatus Kaiserbacteria bacterium CG17_big_fil_post_rev_8_21_14_2_50_51_7]|uniref:Uncharacterized protein n=1 Tax=Candidatus Kaiserbacteria bacterium CG17_big_fil_post_rev_8_21_14_2_50_51_7 TaxID=1974613 RepID=A0A2M7FCQ1_9BACT|nr:MAG: hypothetical protein COW49_00520 [Candidatus Kaiserbacteria bacterium CG17_big_fil_post_rev_8_21_14_2_50_51_7]